MKKSILSVFAVGIPPAISTVLFDLDYVVIDKLMVSYHDLALAAIGIVLKEERFPLNVGIAWSQLTADILTVILSFYVFYRFGPDRQHAG